MYSRSQELNNIIIVSQWHVGDVGDVGDIAIAKVIATNLTGLVNIYVHSQMQFAGNKIMRILLSTFGGKK